MCVSSKPRCRSDLLDASKRALTFGVRVQRVVAVRMLIIGNRPLIPTAAHRQRVDDRDLAGTIAFRISSHVQHEEAMFEPGVVRNVRLLLQVAAAIRSEPPATHRTGGSPRRHDRARQYRSRSRISGLPSSRVLRQERRRTDAPGHTHRPSRNNPVRSGSPRARRQDEARSCS